MKTIIPLTFLTVTLTATMPPALPRLEVYMAKPQIIETQRKNEVKPQSVIQEQKKTEVKPQGVGQEKNAQTEKFEITEEGVLVQYSGQEEIVRVPDGVVEIGEGAFRGNSAIQKVIFPDTVTEIGDSAFQECKNLSDAEGGNLIKIGGYAFYRSPIQKIDLSKVKKIGRDAFSESALEKVHLENVEELGDYAFGNCKNLEEVNGLEYLHECGSGVFRSTLFEKNYWKDETKGSMWIVNGILLLGNHCTGKVVIPENVKKIADHAFSDSELEQVFIPNTVTEMGAYAFSSCSELTSVRMEDSVTYIGQHCFDPCPKLTEIRLSNALTDIGDMGLGIINHCNQLEHLTLPASLKKLGPYTFFNCRKLKMLTVPPDLEECEHPLEYMSYAPFNPAYIIYVTDISQAQKFSDMIKYGARVAELELSAKKVYLGVGSKFPLRFNSYAKAEKWTSSNKKVVTVDRVGNLYAKGAGTATITAEIYGKKYDCEVTVK